MRRRLRDLTVLLLCFALSPFACLSETSNATEYRFEGEGLAIRMQIPNNIRPHTRELGRNSPYLQEAFTTEEELDSYMRQLNAYLIGGDFTTKTSLWVYLHTRDLYANMGFSLSKPLPQSEMKQYYQGKSVILGESTIYSHDDLTWFVFQDSKQIRYCTFLGAVEVTVRIEVGEQHRLGDQDRAMILDMVNSFAYGPIGSGKLEVTEQRLIVVKHYHEGYRGYVYALIKNTGEKPAQQDEGTLKLLGKEGNVLSEDRFFMNPLLLQPGETGVISSFANVPEAKSADDIYSHDLQFTLYDDPFYSVTRYPAEGHYVLEPGADDSTAWLIAQITNDTDSTVFDLDVVYILRDEAGNLLYTTDRSAYGMGIQAGDSALLRQRVDEDLVDYFRENAITPGNVEVIAYKKDFTF